MNEESSTEPVAPGDVPRDQVALDSVDPLVRAPVSQKCGFQATIQAIQAMADAEQSSFKIPVEQLSTEGVELLNQACQDEVLISSGTIRMQTSAGALLSLAEGVPLHCTFEEGCYKLASITPSDHFDTALKILGPHLQSGRLSWQAQRDDDGHLCLTALLADVGTGGSDRTAPVNAAAAAIASVVAAAAAAGADFRIGQDLPNDQLVQYAFSQLNKEIKGPRTGTKGIKVHVSKVDKRELLPTSSTDVPASLTVCEGDESQERHTVPDTMLESRPRSDDPNMYWYSIRYPRSGVPHINEKTTRWKLDLDPSGRLLVTALIGTFEAPPRQDASTTPKGQQQPVRKPPPPPPKLQIYRAQMDKTHKDSLDRHLQGMYNVYGATTQTLPTAVLLKYQSADGEIIGPFPTDVTVIIKKEIRPNRMPGWKYYIPTENLPGHINLEMEKILWWLVTEEEGHIVLTVYPDRDAAPIPAYLDGPQKLAIEQQARARLSLPPTQQLVMPIIPGQIPGQKRPRSPSTLSAAQSLRKLARSAPSEGGTPGAEDAPAAPEDSDGTDTGDEDWGSTTKALHHARRLAADAAASGAGPYDGADVIADVMPSADVKTPHATRTHQELGGGWPSLPHGDSWTEVVQGLLKALRFLGAERVMIARWWHWVASREGVRGWYRRMLLAWQVSQKLNTVEQVQAIFNKMDKELLEHYPDPALAPWATLPATLERAKLRPAPVENLSIDNKVSCSDFITEAVYALKAAELVSMEQANDALLPLLMDTVPDSEVVKCAKRMDKLWSAPDVEGMMWAFLCLASEKAQG